VICGDLK